MTIDEVKGRDCQPFWAGADLPMHAAMTYVVNPDCDGNSSVPPARKVDALSRSGESKGESANSCRHADPSAMNFLASKRLRGIVVVPRKHGPVRRLVAVASHPSDTVSDRAFKRIEIAFGHFVRSMIAQNAFQLSLLSMHIAAICSSTVRHSCATYFSLARNQQVRTRTDRHGSDNSNS